MIAQAKFAVCAGLSLAAALSWVCTADCAGADQFGNGEQLPFPHPHDAHAASPAQQLPIDLASALRLAGGSNLQIALAVQRVAEAYAQYERAKVQWLPSLNAGVGYTRHTGRIQDTRGDVIQVRRSSLFVGGGPVIGGSALAGGAGGPSRLQVDLSLADAIFEPLAARQRVGAAQAARAATFNDVLFQVAVGYQELLRAQSQLAIAEEAIENAERLVRLTQAQIEAEKLLPADGHRVEAELRLRRRLLIAAQERVGVASARLSQLLRLDASVVLFANEDRPLPLHVVPPAPLPQLIAQGVAARPEMGVAEAVLRESSARVNQEHWRPFLPHVYAGVSGGAFGGGGNSFFGDFGGRSDFDVVAVWQLENLGLGNRGRRREVAARNRQAWLLQQQVRDRVAAEVAAAHHRVTARLRQINVARQRVTFASRALPLNYSGIIGDQLRPIEAQQAISAVASARTDYLDAVILYNQAQFELLRAIGAPARPDAFLAAEEIPAGDEEARRQYPMGHAHP